MERLMIILLVGTALAGCATAMPTSSLDKHGNDPQMVIGSTWQWVSTVSPAEKINVPGPQRYTVRLLTDGRVQAQFDCNRGGGSYTIAEGKLSFGPMMSTRMACPPDSLDAPFMRDLQRVASFFVQDGTLYLELPYDSGTMRFRQVP